MGNFRRGFIEDRVVFKGVDGICDGRGMEALED